MAPSFGLCSSQWLHLASDPAECSGAAAVSHPSAWGVARWKQQQQWTAFTAAAASPGDHPAEPPVPKSQGHAGTDNDGGGAEDQDALPTQESGSSIDDILAAKAKNYREYKILVDTGQLPGSFTDGETFIQLIGNRDKSNLMFLKRGFTPASRNEFSIFTKDLGRLEKIRVVANTGNNWFLDRIWFMAPEGNREFPCGRMLGYPNSPEVVLEPALTAMGPAGAALALLLSGCTADARLSRGRVGSARTAELSLRDFL
mmetsp:Transcript_135392/g.235460  ORF Transcript_135392/g.235460 Transcript_135392/m.235460 type:complete len:257 (-) Transcript_135392:20-790(-)